MGAANASRERKIETPIITALIALVGALFVALASHRLSLWRERNTHRRAAAAVFRKEFCLGIEPVLRNEWTMQSDQMIKSALVKQQQAVEQFGFFLGWNRFRFYHAWQKFRSFSEEMNYTEYAASGLYLETLRQQGLKRPSDPRPRFMKLVNAVLSFARET